jgi:hypothetical protein
MDDVKRSESKVTLDSQYSNKQIIKTNRNHD